MSLLDSYKKDIKMLNVYKSSIRFLSVKKIKITRSNGTSMSRETSQYACRKGSLTVEAAFIIPFFACFLVFILYLFRILQVQTAVAQSLQYTGRRMAAEYCIQEADEEGENTDFNAVGGLLKAKLYFQKQLKKQSCPTQYVSFGLSGILLSKSDLSGNYVELKAVYKMKLPVGLLGKFQYRIAQGVKCRKWTGYQPGENENADEQWLYYTEHGTVYHASRTCSHLDLSIQGIPYEQAAQKRNHSGGKYYPCEKCGGADAGGMVYITNYGNRYHTGLSCSGLKRKIYMIRRSKATDKRMCKKCGN